MLHRDYRIIPENAGIVYQQKTVASNVYTDTMNAWFIIFEIQMLSFFLELNLKSMKAALQINSTETVFTELYFFSNMLPFCAVAPK